MHLSTRLSELNREYLEDYEERELGEYKRLEKRIREGRFDFKIDRYPPDERFAKLQKPVAQAARANLWAQIPFSGTLLLFLGPVSKTGFEKTYFKISDIPKVIDFIEDTGKLQVVINGSPLDYENLDFIEPFFRQLNPPVSWVLRPSLFWSEREVQEAEETFRTLGGLGYFDYQRTQAQLAGEKFSLVYRMDQTPYLFLKLGRYSIIEEIENLIVDDPLKAFVLLGICHKFIVNRFVDLRCDLENFRLDEITSAQSLPLVLQPQEIRFPCEIGKFLLRKLTYAAQDMRACYDIIDHYKAHDLHKIQKSLNEAIVTNHPDIVNKNAEELSEILDNVWSDPTIPRRIKNLRRGILVSIAAIGTAMSTFTGGIEGFLAGMGVTVGAAFLKAEIEELSERVGRFFAERTYQANVYDFKKRYKHRIVEK